MIIFKRYRQEDLLGTIKKKIHEAKEDFKKMFIKFIIGILYVR